MTSVPQAFTQALDHHRQGRTAVAAEICRRILQVLPSHADSLHLLAVIAHQMGRHETARALLDQVILLRPEIAAVHDLHGLVLRALGRVGEAAASHVRAVSLKPDFAGALVNLGTALRALDQNREAEDCYRRALTLQPDLPEALNNLGTVLRLQGKAEEAVPVFEQALARRPDYAEAWNNLGNALHASGRIPEAVVAFARALRLKPDFPEAHNNLGNSLRALGRRQEALAQYGQALALRPDFAEAHDNMGTAWQIEGDLAKAKACHTKALALKPDFAEAHNNLASVLQAEGATAAALDHLDAALAIDPGNAAARHNRGMVLLSIGRLEAGWRDYEARWGTPHLRSARRDLDRPRWRGEAADGRTLLVHAEQGFGDTLQFCRYLPLLAERGFRVVVEAPAPLLKLLARLPEVAQVVASGADLPEFDVQCPMLSLPGTFGTLLATVPKASSGYLSADPAAVAAWWQRLDRLEGLKIGLAWAGNPRSRNPDLAAVDRRRSIAPELLAPLFEIPGIRFVSLQKDGPKAPAGFELLDVMAEMTDFADTAALVANLDLVICVDTAVAHLAAGLGKPVWLMNRFDSCWRWLRDRDDSPWYPSLRQFRQTAPGDWAGVVARIGDALSQSLEHAAGLSLVGR